MSHSRTIRVILAFGAAFLLLLLLTFGLMMADTLLSVWERLHRVPLWVAILFLSVIGSVSLFGGWIIWRLLFPRRRRQVAAAKGRPAPPSEAELLSAVATMEGQGVDVAPVQRELRQLRERRAAGEIHIALFGEISSGKSSLVCALLPEAEAEVGVAGGTTRELRRYHWASPAGDRLILTDMPGLAEVGRLLDGLARDEALRAHLVIYLCDGDLTRTQFEEIGLLLELGKPLIVAINKADRLSATQLDQVRGKIGERLVGVTVEEVVTVSAGGVQELIRELPDGSEQIVERTLPPRVEGLQRAIQRVIDSRGETLEQLRDSAVFVLAQRRLDEAQDESRRKRARELVDGYAKKAVVGAMAAMAPGTDLLIQGYLGTQMVRELSELYQIPVRKMDSELLLELVQRHVGRSTTLLLAIAGNGLKAFPGVGTVAGGVLHAVAYGMLFEALGRSIAESLDGRGELHPVQVATQFKETMGEDLEASARRFAKLAFTEAKRLGRDPRPER